MKNNLKKNIDNKLNKLETNLFNRGDSIYDMFNREFLGLLGSLAENLGRNLRKNLKRGD